MSSFTGLFFGPLPKLEELIAVLVEETKEREIPAMQPYCCRELLFTEPRIILSPCLENSKQAFLICQRQVWTCPKFQATSKTLQLKFVEEVKVTRSLMQYCLSFTLMQKLAPLWNKAGDYFIQGREFLESGGKLNAICMDLSITDKICIGMEAVNLKLQPAKIQDFCTNSKVLQNFASSESCTIRDYAIHDDLCFILPSLKRGRVSSITHKLAEGCPFKSYENIRKHWKLMYGYRLPANETTFYNVRFYFNKSKVFTYPASCICSSAPHVYPRCDQQAIFASFINDLQTRLPAICGTPFRLTSHPLYSTNRLHSARQQSHNLTRTEPVLPHCTPFMARISSSSMEDKISADSNNISHGGTKDSDQNCGIELQNPPHSHDKTSRIIPSFTSSRIGSERGKPLEVSGKPRIVPSFGRKVPVPVHKKSTTVSGGHKKDGARTELHSQRSILEAMPLTGNSIRFAEDAPENVAGIVIPSVSADFGNGSSIPRVPHHKKLPISRPNPVARDSVQVTHAMNNNPAAHDTGSSAKTRLLVQHQPAKLPKSRPNPVAREVNHAMHLSPAAHKVSTSVPKVIPCVQLQQRKLPDCRPGLISTSQQVARNTIHNTKSVNAPRLISSLQGSAVGYGGQDSLSLLYNCPPGVSCLDKPCHGSTTGQERQNKGHRAKALTKRPQFTTDDHEPQAKKPRTKVKLQENMDVRQRALDGQLHKVNTVTLMDWLRKRHVAVKSKDKKAELMEKAVNYITLHQHEG